MGGPRSDHKAIMKANEGERRAENTYPFVLASTNDEGVRVRPRCAIPAAHIFSPTPQPRHPEPHNHPATTARLLVTAGIVYPEWVFTSMKVATVLMTILS
jgi:hypothetical protein